MEWIAIMKYVGGFESYQALLGDSRAYEDVLIAMAGEGDAARIVSMEREMRRGQ